MPHKTLYKNLTKNGMNVHFIDGLNDIKGVWNGKVSTLKRNRFAFPLFNITRDEVEVRSGAP